MKMRSTLACVVAAATAVSMISVAHASDLVWDSSGSGGATPVDGSGTWDLTSPNWSNGASNVAWTNTGNNAQFGNATSPFDGNVGPLTVDLRDAIVVNNIVLGTSTLGTIYNFSDFQGGSLTLNGNVNKISGNGAIAFGLNQGLALGSGTHVFALHDSPGDDAPELRIDGVISGAGAITLDNGSQAYESWGSLLLNGANTYTGVTNITNGRLTILNSSSLGSSAAASGTVISDDGTLAIGSPNNSPGGDLTINEPITVTRSVYSGGQYGNYGAAIIASNSGRAHTYTLAGPLVIDSDDVRVAAQSSTLEIANIQVGTHTTNPTLSVTGDFAGFVHLSGNNTALTGGVKIMSAVELNVDNDNQIGGPSAPLQFIGGGVYHPVNGYATTLGTHVVNTATFSGGIDIDAGKVFTIDRPLGPALGNSTTRVGALGERGTGTLNINAAVNLRGNQTYWDGGTINVNAPMEIANLHLRSPIVNIGTGGSITMDAGYSSLGQDTTGTNGGPDIAVVNITGDGKLIQTNGDDFNISDNANTRGTINLGGNGVLTTSGITFVGRNNDAIGTINQTGGTFTVNRSGNFAFVLGDGRFGRTNVQGVYNLSGGIFTTGGETYVGEGGGAVGTWTQSGGTATISNWFVVGRESGSGDVDISGGTLIKKGGGNTPIGEGTNARGITFNVRGTGTFDAQTGEVWVSNGNNPVIMTVKDTGKVNVNNWFAIGRFGGSNGTLNIQDGAIVTKAGSNFTVVAPGGGSTGTVNQTGGTYSDAATETWIGDGGDGVWNFSGGTINSGNIFDVGHNGGGNGTLNVSGTAVMNAATIRIGEAGSVNGTFNLSGGTVKADTIVARNSTGAKTFNFTGGTLAAGTFNVGSGLANTGTGKLSPGLAAAGSTVIGGTYTQGATASMAIDLGGSTAGTFDKVTVTGAVTLNGKLSLTRLAAYDPANLTAHTILTGSAVSGKFSTIDGVIVSGPRRLAVTYTPTSVVVTAARAGDADLNGTVNFDDLLILAQNYNSASVTSWATGDFDGTGTTVFDDLLALAQNYGLSGVVAPTDLGSSFSSDFQADWTMALSIVPEPGSFALIGMLGSALLRRSRSR